MGSVLVTVLALRVPILCLAVVIWISYKMLQAIVRSNLVRKLFTG